VATLARYAGDEELRRKCQGRILALNERYREVAGGAGVKAEFGRTFVQGFKDGTENVLTDGNSFVIMASDSNVGLYPITRESIESVPQFTEFASPEINEAVHKACVEILEYLVNDQIGTEGTISLPISKVVEYNAGKLVMKDLKDKGESGDGGVRIIDLNEPYIAIHNHPSGATFSIKDLDCFGRLSNCKGIVVIGNNGKSTYSLIKNANYDSYGFSWLRAMKAVGLKTESVFFEEVTDYGVYYTTRTN